MSGSDDWNSNGSGDGNGNENGDAPTMQCSRWWGGGNNWEQLGWMVDGWTGGWNSGVELGR